MGKSAAPGAVRTRSIVALAHVASVPRSIAYYAHLGFEVRGDHVAEGAVEPVWVLE